MQLRNIQTRPFVIFLLILFVIGMVKAFALSLSNAIVHSKLTEQVDLLIPINGKQFSLSDLEVEIQPKEKRTDRFKRSLYKSFKTDFVERDGKKYLRITSQEMSVEPFLNFDVHLTGNGIDYTKEYTVLFDPPTTITQRTYKPESFREIQFVDRPEKNNRDSDSQAQDTSKHAENESVPAKKKLSFREFLGAAVKAYKTAPPLTAKSDSPSSVKDSKKNEVKKRSAKTSSKSSRSKEFTKERRQLKSLKDELRKEKLAKVLNQRIHKEKLRELKSQKKAIDKQQAALAKKEQALAKKTYREKADRQSQAEQLAQFKKEKDALLAREKSLLLKMEEKLKIIESQRAQSEDTLRKELDKKLSAKEKEWNKTLTDKEEQWNKALTDKEKQWHKESEKRSRQIALRDKEQALAFKAKQKEVEAKWQHDLEAQKQLTQIAAEGKKVAEEKLAYREKIDQKRKTDKRLTKQARHLQSREVGKNKQAKLNQARKTKPKKQSSKGTKQASQTTKKKRSFEQRKVAKNSASKKSHSKQPNKKSNAIKQAKEKASPSTSVASTNHELQQRLDKLKKGIKNKEQASRSQTKHGKRLESMKLNSLARDVENNESAKALKAKLAQLKKKAHLQQSNARTLKEDSDLRALQSVREAEIRLASKERAEHSNDKLKHLLEAKAKALLNSEKRKNRQLDSKHALAGQNSMDSRKPKHGTTQSLSSMIGGGQSNKASAKSERALSKQLQKQMIVWHVDDNIKLDDKVKKMASTKAKVNADDALAKIARRASSVAKSVRGHNSKDSHPAVKQIKRKSKRESKKLALLFEEEKHRSTASEKAKQLKHKLNKSKAAVKHKAKKVIEKTRVQKERIKKKVKAKLKSSKANKKTGIKRASKTNKKAGIKRTSNRSKRAQQKDTRRASRLPVGKPEVVLSNTWGEWGVNQGKPSKRYRNVSAVHSDRDDNDRPKHKRIVRAPVIKKRSSQARRGVSQQVVKQKYRSKPKALKKKKATVEKKKTIKNKQPRAAKKAKRKLVAKPKAVTVNPKRAQQKASQKAKNNSNKKDAQKLSSSDLSATSHLWGEWGVGSRGNVAQRYSNISDNNPRTRVRNIPTNNSTVASNDSGSSLAVRRVQRAGVPFFDAYSEVMPDIAYQSGVSDSPIDINKLSDKQKREIAPALAVLDNALGYTTASTASTATRSQGATVASTQTQLYDLLPSVGEPLSTVGIEQIRSNLTNGQLTSGSYGRVKYADTLWSIAKDLSKGKPYEVVRMAVALYETNPQAFYSNNMHALDKNAMLYVPHDDVVAEISIDAAERSLNRHTRAWGNGKSSVASKYSLIGPKQRAAIAKRHEVAGTRLAKQETQPGRLAQAKTNDAELQKTKPLTLNDRITTSEIPEDLNIALMNDKINKKVMKKLGDQKVLHYLEEIKQGNVAKYQELKEVMELLKEQSPELAELAELKQLHERLKRQKKFFELQSSANALNPIDAQLLSDVLPDHVRQDNKSSFVLGGITDNRQLGLTILLLLMAIGFISLTIAFRQYRRMVRVNEFEDEFGIEHDMRGVLRHYRSKDYANAYKQLCSLIDHHESAINEPEFVLVSAMVLERFNDLARLSKLEGQLPDDFKNDHPMTFESVGELKSKLNQKIAIEKDAKDKDYLDDVSTDDIMASKLDLATAYIHMGKLSDARLLLLEVVSGGDKPQQAEALNLLKKIGKEGEPLN